MTSNPAGPKHSCPKCSSGMEQGFVVDNSPGARLVSQWAPGLPQKSFWVGTKLPRGALPLAAFRCTSCGFTEFYSGEQFAAK